MSSKLSIEFAKLSGQQTDMKEQLAQDAQTDTASQGTPAGDLGTRPTIQRADPLAIPSMPPQQGGATTRLWIAGIAGDPNKYLVRAVCAMDAAQTLHCKRQVIPSKKLQQIDHVYLPENNDVFGTNNINQPIPLFEQAVGNKRGKVWVRPMAIAPETVMRKQRGGGGGRGRKGPSKKNKDDVGAFVSNVVYWFDEDQELMMSGGGKRQNVSNLRYIGKCNCGM